jgi:hypothetical protein
MKYLYINPLLPPEFQCTFLKKEKCFFLLTPSVFTYLKWPYANHCFLKLCLLYILYFVTLLYFWSLYIMNFPSHGILLYSCSNLYTPSLWKKGTSPSITHRDCSYFWMITRLNFQHIFGVCTMVGNYYISRENFLLKYWCHWSTYFA